MESKRRQYIKPAYKIVGRFLSEWIQFVKNGNGITEPIRDFKAYYRYNRLMKGTLEAKLPWISHRAYLKLNQLVKPDWNVFEFGCGGSTLFLNGKVKTMTSIEHDPDWTQVVSKKLADNPNFTVRYISEDEEGGEEFKSVHGLNEVGSYFETYAKAASDLPDESLDLLIIDGRARPACLKYSHTKVKSGGYLLFDNSNRDSYHEAIEEYLKDWEREDFKGVTVYDAFFNQTSLFRKT
ncbi:hypothetical protein DFQ04_1417 [Algoriphagus boseongensis]|uniref:Methyltransferase family protein n=1 Tax=Algoriphagus boseongensis TaxID=1442587 RepID=A0A4R6TBG8_9BACT|nr:hypothetical protein [Algoriphagus boseongensis]TDQ19593.1 hypothetical protein DFQ04_1417 [Algoriphagus boseongensis]